MSGVVGRATVLGAALLLLVTTPVGAQDVAAIREALFGGRYDEVLRETGGVRAPAALILRTRALLERGDAAAAVRLLGGPGGPAPSPAVERWLGEALLRVGELDAAEAAFRRAEGEGAPDALTARVRRGEILLARGERDAAFALFDTFIDVYNSGRPLDGDDLLAVATAVTALGQRTPVLYQDALRALDEARAASPGDPRPLVATGDLFLARYNAPEAHAAYRAVLARNPAHPDALVGEARALEFDGAPGAMELARDALATDPGHVGAHLFLARQQLRTEDFTEARTHVEQALATNPASLDALSMAAALHHLAGDEAGYTAARDRALALNPTWPDLFNTVAELSVDTRKYADAVAFAREAVARDSLSWRGWGILGTNQLRNGEIEAGRRNLERAFAGDPYNVWFKNQLDLLDTFDQYRVIETPRVHLMLHASEADLLEPYAVSLAEEAFAALRTRYGITPPTPVRIELYPRSADFSVRTFGLVGIGALGVSFGSTLVMDSPSARGRGEFNWQSVLWHEMAHAFHLAMSAHEVPRWFSEGLAVRDQRVARPGWGQRVSPAWLRAWDSGRMPPVSALNDAFVRPAFPEQVGLAYLQGSLVFDWIETTWGLEAIRAFLTGYGEGRTTAELTEAVLGLSLAEVDAAFDAHVRRRFAQEFATATAAPPTPLPSGAGRDDIDELRRRAEVHPDDLETRLALAGALVAAGRLDEAEREAREAIRLFPTYGGPNGPWGVLAAVHEGRGEVRLAADALRAAALLDERAVDLSLREAELRREIDDAAGERDALARAVTAWPFDLAPHQRLAELHARAGDTGAEVIERQAVVALAPAGIAEARYLLARALRDDGRPDEARSQLLRALEVAPSYAEALELLLELREGRP